MKLIRDGSRSRNTEEAKQLEKHKESNASAAETTINHKPDPMVVNYSKLHSERGAIGVNVRGDFK